MPLTNPLTSVDSLRITFLVDNCIEWMTKLPPGFTHEIRQHLSNDHKLDPRTGVPIVDLENFCCGAHGFSALIETQVTGSKSYLTLFDTGPDSRSLVRNVIGMQVPHADIDRVVISHWHRDHTGGLLSFLKLRGTNTASDSAAQAFSPTCVVDIHPDRPIARGISVPPTYEKVICRLPDDPTFEQIQEMGGTIEAHREGHAVAGGTVWISGEIPRVTECEGGIPGGVRWVEKSGAGKWIKDEDIMDERYAAIDVFGKGLVIFSACSHAGIVNVVRDATAKFSRPIFMIVGGLHLAGPELAARIPLTVHFLSRKLKPAPTYILPMHCSGFNAKAALQAEFGEACVPAGVGMRVDIVGERERDGELFPPVC